jgi:hypothetical protein
LKTPIFLPSNTTVNPYLGITSLWEKDGDAWVRDLADRAKTWIERLMNTLVVADITNPEQWAKLIPTLRERGFTEKSPFFITNGGGNSLAQGSIQFLEMNGGILETIWSFGNHGASLASRKVLAQIQAQNHEAELALFNIQPGSTLIEIWAGDDILRLKTFDTHMRSIGGRLICQEQVAAWAHWAGVAIPEIPYIPLPNRADILNPLFDKKNNHILSMQNVVSSMSLSGINQLIAFAKDLQAQKMTITQSLGIADNSNLFPENLRPKSTEIAWINLVLRMYEQGGAWVSVSEKEMQLVVHQAEVTARNIMTELVRKYIQNATADSVNLKKHRTTLLTHSTVLEGARAASYLGDIPQYLVKVLADTTHKRNTIISSPFNSLKTDFDPSLPAGAIRVNSTQAIVEHASRFTEIPKFSRDIGLEQISGEKLLTPVKFRFVDEALLWFGDTLLWFWSKSPSREKLIFLKQTGAAIAHWYIFDLLWRQMGHPLLRGVSQHTVKYYHDEFVSRKGL